MANNNCYCFYYIADFDDFNNTVLTIVFEPDEDEASVNQKEAFIPITDDLVDEADEQVFVALIRVIESLDSDSVILTQRNVSLCRINDNDGKRFHYYNVMQLCIRIFIRFNLHLYRRQNWISISKLHLHGSGV